MPLLKSLRLSCRPLWRACCVGAFAVLLGASPVHAEPQTIVLARAEFSDIDAGGAPQQVSLPDTWARRGAPNHGHGRYRLHFALDQVPTQPWALSLARVSSSRRVFLNGVLIEEENPGGRRNPEPDLIMLPTQLLAAGPNSLEIELRYRARAGLSQAVLGPASALQAEDRRRTLFERELPRSLNVGMAMVAALMLLIRLRRPGETTIALFGALALLGSLRNYSYFSDVSLVRSALSDWLYFSAQIWTAALFVAFARSIGAPGPQQHGTRQRGTRLLLALALGLPLLAAMALPLGLLPAMRTAAYPLLLVAGAVAVGLLWRGGREHGAVLNGALALSFAAVIAAGVHDYLFQQGLLPLTGRFWMPYVMPLALGGYALLLLNRFVGALGEVEVLRDTLEAQVAQRTQALEVAVAAKTRFLAAASHDLRQPAVAIGLMIGLVRERTLASDVRPLIERAHQAVGSLESLLQGLLDLSRLDSGTVQPRIAAVPLQAVFDAIHSHEAELAAAKGLRLRFRAQDLVLQCDAQLLEQLLRNLVANALRYTERGGVLVCARPRGRHQVLVQVWDTGIGIQAQQQAEVFDEFVQGHNPGRDSRLGLGLGLALVKRCAVLLGTHVQLRSVPGHGSCFGVLLPRLERRAVARASEPATAAQPLSGRRLLVVDDDAAVRQALAARLVAWGASVTACDGLQGVRDWLDAGHARPDMLLTDQQLGAGNGLQVIAAVHERHGAVPALLVTGNTAPAEIARFAASGVPLLHKPFRAEALLAAIERAAVPG
ncbi:MAG TPA: hybrid sensor histidine kinase/response regulator [Rubrivivax sp.]|nr:hybrid sensor histidine kinase/response regulator [Rubrivivax sp.]HRY89319.1 hybrid sensor histidine kinase/response regulator [Rubrivivax sp.]